MSLHRMTRDMSIAGFGDFMRVNEKGERITLDGYMKREVPIRTTLPRTIAEITDSIQCFVGATDNRSG